MALKALRRALLVLLVAGGREAVASGPDLLEVGAGVASRRLYQGYERGDGWSLMPEVELGLAGFATTSIGRWGVFLDLEGGLLLEDREAHPGSDDVALTLRYRQKLGGDDSWLQATYRQSFYSEAVNVPAHSEEVFLRLQTLIGAEKPGFSINPFVEVAYDFTRYDGLYAAIGFEHALTLEDKLGMPASVDVTGRAAWSDRRAGDLIGSRDFGFHHAAVGIGVPFEHEMASSVLVFGPFVDWDWADDAVRTTSGFSWGVRIVLKR